MPNILAARSQMAMSLAFHIIFSCIGIAMPLLMVVAEWRYRRTGDNVYLLLARRCFARAEAQWGAVLLVTLCLTVPVAGSSLFLMDPYVTSRSISTPVTLLAVVACLDRRLLRALGRDLIRGEKGE